METQFLTPNDLAELFGVSVRTIDRAWRDGRFPAPLRIGRRALRWPEETIAEFIQSQPAVPAEHNQECHQ